MDLLTLLSVCTLGFDTKLMQGISIIQSNGKPYSYKMDGRIFEFDDVQSAIKAARLRQEEGKKIRIGIMGADIDLLSATAEPNEAMFEPCLNINIASRTLDSYKDKCEQEGHSSPEICAISSYMGEGFYSQNDTYIDQIMIGSTTNSFDNPKVITTREIKKEVLNNPEPIEDFGSIFFDKEAIENEKTDEENSIFLR